MKIFKHLKKFYFILFLFLLIFSPQSVKAQFFIPDVGTAAKDAINFLGGWKNCLINKNCGSNSTPLSNFNELASPLITQARTQRNRRKKNDPDYNKRINEDVNKNRINVLLFGNIEEYIYANDERLIEHYSDLGGSMTLLSYDLESGQLATISFSRDIFAPNLKKLGKIQGYNSLYFIPTLRYAYKGNGFTSTREVIESATGLVVDFQIFYKDVVLRDFVRDMLGGTINVTAPKDEQVGAYRFGGQDLPEGVINAGPQVMSADKSMQFVFAESLNPQTKEDERSFRQNVFLKSLKQESNQQFGKKNIASLQKLISLYNFIQKRLATKDMILDFDPNILQNSINIISNYLSKLIQRQNGLGLQPPNLNEDQSLLINDPMFGGQGVIRMHKIYDNPSDYQQASVQTKSMMKEHPELLPDWMLLTTGGNPDALDNPEKDYWQSVRQIIQSKYQTTSSEVKIDDPSVIEQRLVEEDTVDIASNCQPSDDEDYQKYYKKDQIDQCIALASSRNHPCFSASQDDLACILTIKDELLKKAESNAQTPKNVHDQLKSNSANYETYVGAYCDEIPSQKFISKEIDQKEQDRLYQLCVNELSKTIYKSVQGCANLPLAEDPNNPQDLISCIKQAATKVQIPAVSNKITVSPTASPNIPLTTAPPRSSPPTTPIPSSAAVSPSSSPAVRTPAGTVLPPTNTGGQTVSTNQCPKITPPTGYNTNFDKDLYAWCSLDNGVDPSKSCFCNADAMKACGSDKDNQKFVSCVQKTARENYNGQAGTSISPQNTQSGKKYNFAAVVNGQMYPIYSENITTAEIHLPSDTKQISIGARLYEGDNPQACVTGMELGFDVYKIGGTNTNASLPIIDANGIEVEQVKTAANPQSAPFGENCQPYTVKLPEATDYAFTVGLDTSTYPDLKRAHIGVLIALDQPPGPTSAQSGKKYNFAAVVNGQMYPIYSENITTSPEIHLPSDTKQISIGARLYEGDNPQACVTGEKLYFDVANISKAGTDTAPLPIIDANGIEAKPDPTIPALQNCQPYTVKLLEPGTYSFAMTMNNSNYLDLNNAKVRNALIFLDQPPQNPTLTKFSCETQLDTQTQNSFTAKAISIGDNISYDRAEWYLKKGSPITDDPVIQPSYKIGDNKQFSQGPDITEFKNLQQDQTYYVQAQAYSTDGTKYKNPCAWYGPIKLTSATSQAKDKKNLAMVLGTSEENPSSMPLGFSFDTSDVSTVVIRSYDLSGNATTLEEKQFAGPEQIIVNVPNPTQVDRVEATVIPSTSAFENVDSQTITVPISHPATSAPPPPSKVQNVTLTLNPQKDKFTLDDTIDLMATTDLKVDDPKFVKLVDGQIKETYSILNSDVDKKEICVTDPSQNCVYIYHLSKQSETPLTAGSYNIKFYSGNSDLSSDSLNFEVNAQEEPAAPPTPEATTNEKVVTKVILSKDDGSEEQVVYPLDQSTNQGYADFDLAEGENFLKYTVSFSDSTENTVHFVVERTAQPQGEQSTAPSAQPDNNPKTCIDTVDSNKSYNLGDYVRRCKDGTHCKYDVFQCGENDWQYNGEEEDCGRCPDTGGGNNNQPAATEQPSCHTEDADLGDGCFQRYNVCGDSKTKEGDPFAVEGGNCEGK